MGLNMNELMPNLLKTTAVLLVIGHIAVVEANAQTADFSDFIIKSPAPIAGQVHSRGYITNNNWNDYSGLDQSFNDPTADYYDEPMYVPW